MAFLVRWGFFAILLLGCQTGLVTSQISKDRKPRAVASNEGFKLKQADSLGIRYQVESLRPLVVKFDKLTPEEFQKLRKAYGGLSQVRYESGKTYDLVDFLPPVIQALIDFSAQFRPHTQTPDWLKSLTAQNLPALSFAGQAVDSISVDQNCWGTSYEVTRLMQNREITSYSVFMNSQKQIQSELAGHLQTLSPSTASFGDWLFIFNVFDGGSRFLGHTAIIIDENLFFEKEGPGDGKKWQLVTLEELQERWADSEEMPVHFEYARIRGALKDPKVFSINENRTSNNLELSRIVPQSEQGSLIYSIDTASPMMGRPQASLYRISKQKLSTDARSGRGIFN